MALGDQFSVLTVKNGQGTIRENIRHYTFQGRLASVRCIDIHLSKLVEDWDLTFGALLTEARKALSDDRADVLVLGCTGLSEYAPALTAELGVPVIDPWACAVKMAAALVEMGLSHSRVAYPLQPKERKIRR
jgi:allantoin racemase